MPTIGALALATLLALFVEGLLGPYLGVRAKAAVVLGLWLGVFYSVRKFLRELRGY